jgi:hypothetical protein
MLDKSESEQVSPRQRLLSDANNPSAVVVSIPSVTPSPLPVTRTAARYSFWSSPRVAQDFMLTAIVSGLADVILDLVTKFSSNAESYLEKTNHPAAITIVGGEIWTSQPM